MKTRRKFISCLFGAGVAGTVPDAASEKPQYDVYFTTDDGSLKGWTRDGKIDVLYDGSAGAVTHISAAKR